MWDFDPATGETIGETSASAELANVPHVSVGIAQPSDETSGMLGMIVQASQALVREPAKLIARAKQIGGLLGAAGFYRFPAGGSTVQGPSISMAEALAQEWGGIVYQVRIVNAEQLASGGQRVHLRATVADMKSLVVAEVDQVVSTAPPPGKFADKVDQRERWHGMQIQSAASKIVRNAILRVLPAWYVDPAFDASVAIDGGRALNGKTLVEARKGAVDALKEFGCGQGELETHLGQALDMWAVPQISALKELYRSLKSGTQSIEAWRAGLSAKTEAPAAPRKTALGLPAASESKPIDATPPPAKETANAKGKAKGGEELFQSEPGANG